MSNKYDIFISYRRKDAGDKAEHLKDLLESYYKGRISFDRENLTGKFNVQLIERIDHVKDFLLVIGKKSLCYNDEDKSNESMEATKPQLPVTLMAGMTIINMQKQDGFIVTVIEVDENQYNLAGFQSKKALEGIENYANNYIFKLFPTNVL